VKNKVSHILFFFLFTLFLCSVIFIFPPKCSADKNDLEITEIMYKPHKNEKGARIEWIELYANKDKDFELKSNGQLKDFYFCTKKDNLCANSYATYAISDNLNIKKGDFLIATKDPEIFKDLQDVKIIKLSSSFNLLGNNDAYIAYSDDNKLNWKENIKYCDFFDKKVDGYSLEKIIFNKENSIDNWQESCVFGGTPGKSSSLKSNCAKLTEENKPTLKIKKDKDIYENIYANFEINYPNATKKTKYTWNFGDEHKSYLQKTRHKYKKSGIYQASITIRGDKKDFQSFTVKVSSYSAPKVKITSLIPNPKGKDSKEFIVIKNQSKKKINLKGWSIATGWKNLVNHPIRENFVINPGKTKKLTKKICAFTLNNSQNKIELRYPDGKIVQKLKYNRKKDKISEDEVFEINNKNWTWNKPQTNTNDMQNTNDNPKAGTENKQIIMENNLKPTTEEENIEIKIDELEIKENLGKFSKNSDFSAKRKDRIQLIGYATKINTPESVLSFSGKIAGDYTEKIDRLEKKHWVLQITNIIWVELNSSINNILNKI